MSFAGMVRGESMNKLDASDQSSPWHSQPLCRQYMALFLDAAPVLVLGADGPEDQLVNWALGCTASGEFEFLGACKQPGAGLGVPTLLCASLENRGVERIRFAIGRQVGGAAGRFGLGLLGATELPSIERSMRVVLAQVQAGDWAAVAGALYAVFVSSRRKAVDAAMAAVEAGPLGEGYAPLVVQWRALASRWAPVFALPVAQRRLVLAVDRLAADSHKGLFRAIARHGPFIDLAAAVRFVAVVLHRAGHRLDRERADFVAAGCEPRGVALGRLAMASEPRG
jgi:hypothetical protein